MITELKKKEIISVKEMMDAHKKNIEDANKGLESITEKYKRLMEEEKKSLKESLSDSKSQLKMWEKMFNSFDSTVVKEALGSDYVTDATDSDKVEASDSSDDEVIDSLFQDIDEETDDENAEVNESGDEEDTDDAADNEPKPESLAGIETAPDAAEEIKPEKTDEATMSFDDDNDDEWPDMPDF